MAACRQPFLSLFRRNFRRTLYQSRHPHLMRPEMRLLSDQILIIGSSDTEPPIPVYKSPQNELVDRKRARLFYKVGTHTNLLKFEWCTQSKQTKLC